MRRKLIITTTIILAMILATPFILNRRRISEYEDRVSHILTFKTENWYLPDKIPEAATGVYYNYSDGWGQGGDTNTLRFRLPEKASKTLHSRIVSENSSQGKSDSTRPKIVGSERYEELVWTAYKGNHGSSGGVWYDSGKREFVFHHFVW
jgi:hypothetical protein